MSSSPSSSSSSERARHPFAPMFEAMCRVDVVLGTSVMSVRACLDLRKDAIIRIDQPAGGDMQVLVNGIPIARGDVMIVDESTSIRITEVLAPAGFEVE